MELNNRISIVSNRHSIQFLIAFLYQRVCLCEYLRECVNSSFCASAQRLMYIRKGQKRTFGKIHHFLKIICWCKSESFILSLTVVTIAWNFDNARTCDRFCFSILIVFTKERNGPNTPRSAIRPCFRYTHLPISQWSSFWKPDNSARSFSRIQVLWTN
jgi:hypothetical protein